ncbi:MAG: hypothetical protein AB1486_18450 [Planctomycetota bacterium]
MKETSEPPTVRPQPSRVRHRRFLRRLPFAGALLLIHGADDFKVPVEQSEALHDAAPQQSKLLILDRVGHDRSIEDPRTLQAAIDWFEEHLGG